ncbi:PREDICTED: uncharacterized protein LOC109231491 [Nicotiana attenuata]|uniref:uncharacterized protein LOC109231491 n=1 Tax=Nicotiana attenuata TaxID=49451 RepID=UPI0009051827|nr:PREDICTED: uncharacterized protein LOC109231491 [Nicotiana attenuata]
MPWRKLVCNNGGMPNWTFILTEEESIEHLFFKCTFAESIWMKLLQWMGINRQAMKWSQEVVWAYNNAKGRSANAEIYRMALAGCVYYVWQERNHRIFRAKQRQAGIMIKQIIQMICERGYMMSRLRRRLEDLNFYP